MRRLKFMQVDGLLSASKTPPPPGKTFPKITLIGIPYFIVYLDPSNLTSVYSVPAINILLAIRYSSILFSCPNHLHTLNALYSPALQCTSSFLTLSIHDTPTKILQHCSSRTFTILLSALLIPQDYESYNAVGTINP